MQHLSDSISQTTDEGATCVAKPVLIKTSYVSIGCLKRQFSFPFSDSFFDNSSSEFSSDLAKASLGLAVSADRFPDLPLERQHEGVKNFLERAGFANLRFFRYDTAPTEFTAALAMGCKLIKNSVFVAITLCGNGYGDEWIGNLTAGKGTVHQGFEEASECVLSDIREYLREIKEKDAEGRRVKIWAAGYSRASAILSLALPALLDASLCGEVYAYLFATPFSTENAKSVPGMFNILNPDDPFANIRPKSVSSDSLESRSHCHKARNGNKSAMHGGLDSGQSVVAVMGGGSDDDCEHFIYNGKNGSGRNGADIILKTEDTVSDKDGFIRKVRETADELHCATYRISPQINGFFNTVLRYLRELCFSLADFSDIFEEPLIAFYKNHGIKGGIKACRILRKNVKKHLPKERRKIFTSFFCFILKNALFFYGKKKRLIKNGEWIASQRADTNILREHAGDMYVLRVFANW